MCYSQIEPAHGEGPIQHVTKTALNSTELAINVNNSAAVETHKLHNILPQNHNCDESPEFRPKSGKPASLVHCRDE